MKKVLFLINGLGLGNSTRCDAIIQNLLKKNIEVHVASSGNGYQYFSKVRPNIPLYHLDQPQYSKDKNGKLSPFSTLLSLPKLLFLLYANIQKIKVLLKTYNYDGVVFDSEYSVIFLKKTCPFIALNNADYVIEECKKNQPLPYQLKGQYIIEKLDALFCQLFATQIISPHPVGRPSDHQKITRITPIVRSGIIDEKGSETTSLKKGVIMLSGSQFQMQLNFLEKLKDLPIQWSVIGRESGPEPANYLGKDYNNLTTLKQADLIIANAGFSALSECIALNKPTIIIPIENHCEQYINSSFVESLGLGISSCFEDIEKSIRKIYDDYTQYLTPKSLPQTNGAEQASSIIIKAIG